MPVAQIFRGWRWLWHSHGIFPFVFVPAFLLMIFVIQAEPSPTASEKIKACDRAVDALLNSRDLVEVQRAGILIDNLGCSVAKRLARP